MTGHCHLSNPMPHFAGQDRIWIYLLPSRLGRHFFQIHRPRLLKNDSHLDLISQRRRLRPSNPIEKPPFTYRPSRHQPLPPPPLPLPLFPKRKRRQVDNIRILPPTQRLCYPDSTVIDLDVRMELSISATQLVQDWSGRRQCRLLLPGVAW